MVQSTAATVDEYMTTLEPGRVVAMTRVRDLGREIFNGWAETMAHVLQQLVDYSLLRSQSCR